MSSQDPLPHRIGDFTIRGLLGKGGIGIVYLAEQTEPVRRTVALKVLSERSASAEILHRFAAERQALAVMDHPSIAKVFDAGSTDDGRPYFVMEVVEGSEIVDYCDARSLGLRERVTLYIDVCRAVQHAHQKGVIHRDIKPSNVLVSEVDGRPVPRVIDFGIAKAVEADDFEGTRLTRDDQVIGTPAYMSPEQVLHSGDMDTRSDVFSLGVLLYELLVGSLPYDPASYRGWASVAANLHRDPPRLQERLAALGELQGAVASQRATTPAHLRRELAGDLQWIVSQAMEREKDARYETANGLALDLERFLRNEPVRARGAGAGYRARKFVRRHRVAVGFGATVAAGLVAFAGAMTVQADRIARARDEADARRNQAESLIDFMLGDLRAQLEPIGRLDILAGVGQQAVGYFSSLPEELFTDDELQSRSQALYQIGSVRLDQGHSEEAQVALEESLRLAKALAARDPENNERLFGLCQSHFYVGYAAWLSGNLDAAEEDFQAYLTVAETLVQRDPENPEYRMELGFAHSNIGSLQEARGELADAVESYSRALEAEQAAVQGDSTNVSWIGELSESHNKLAVVHRKQGHYAEALREHTREMELKRRVLRLSPTHAYWTRRLAWAEHYMGRIELILGDLALAEGSFEDALATVAPLIERDPSNLTLRRSQAVFQTHLAGTLSLLGRNEEARAMVREAIPDLEEQVGQDSTRVSMRMSLASAHEVYARVLLRTGDPGTALGEAEAARSILEDMDPEDRSVHADRARTLLVLGDALEALRRASAATDAREEAVSLLEQLVEDPGGDEFRPALAEALLSLDRLPEAAREMETLASQGYREPRLMALSAEKGIGV
jgi:serine/threonine-protein kinase